MPSYICLIIFIYIYIYIYICINIATTYFFEHKEVDL